MREAQIAARRDLFTGGIMVVYLLNDRKIEQTVYTNGFHNNLGTLRPGEGREFHIQVDEGSALFVKVWEHGSIMLDTITVVGKGEL